MAVTVKSFDKPDETRSFGTGVLEVVTIGSTTMGRTSFEPGWRWSKDVKPIVGTDRCMVLHKGVCVSGTLVVQADDGTETQIGAGDGYVIEPGHDAWVAGDETYVGGDFSDQIQDYAKQD